MNLGSLIISLGVDASALKAAELRMNQTVDRVLRKADEIKKQSNEFEKLGGMLYTWGIRWSMYITAPITAAGYAIVNVTKDFEQSMSRIAGLVGESREQVKQWSDEILNIAPSLGRTPKELAEGLYFITSSGIEGAEAMDVLTQSAKAATAGLGSVESVADLVTSAMNAYSDEGLTASRVLDIVTAAVREGKTEASAFAKEVGQVIPIAAELGVSFAEVSAAVASMSLTGTNASEAVVYLRGILNSLLDPSDQATQALNKMRLSSEGLRAQLSTDLMGTLKTITDLTKVYGEELVSQVFPNVRALTGVLSLMGDHFEENIKIFEEVYASTGDMDRAFQEATNTIQHRFDKALSTVQANFIKIGLVIKDELIPWIERFTKFMNNIGDLYSNMSEGMQVLITKLTMLVAVWGPLLLAASFLYKIVIPMVIAAKAKWAIATGAVTNALTLLNAAIAANPIGALLVMLGALIAAYATVRIRTQNAAKAQMDYNKSIEQARINELAQTLTTANEGFRKVQAIMNDLDYGDQDALQAAKQAIDEQIAYEKTLTKVIEEEVRKRIAADKSLQWMRTSPNAANGIGQAELNKRIAQREQEVTDEVNRIYQGRLTLLEEWNAKIEKALKGVDVYVSPIKKILDEIATEESKITRLDQYIPEFDANEESLSLYEGALRDLLAIENLSAKESIELADALQFVADKMKYLKKDEDAFKLGAFEEGFVVATKRLETFGDVNEYNSEMLSLFAAEWDKLVSKGETASEWYQLVTQAVKDYTIAVEQAKDKSADFQQKLDFLKYYAAATGEIGLQMNILSEQMTQYENLAEQAFSEGKLAEVDAYIEKIQQVQDEMTKLNNKQMVFNALAGFVVNAFQDLGAALIDSENAMISMVDNLINTLQQVINYLLMEALAQAMVSGLKTGKGNVIVGLALAAMAMGAVEAMWQAHKGNIGGGGAAKMAGGGIVPAGYPNDTYPALLTSGEAVIPPHKLKEQKPFSGRVVFDIEGKKLRGVLEAYDSYLENVT